MDRFIQGYSHGTGTVSILIDLRVHTDTFARIDI
jgi:hypothetical protein